MGDVAETQEGLEAHLLGVFQRPDPLVDIVQLPHLPGIVPAGEALPNLRHIAQGECRLFHFIEEVIEVPGRLPGGGIPAGTPSAYGDSLLHATRHDGSPGLDPWKDAVGDIADPAGLHLFGQRRSQEAGPVPRLADENQLILRLNQGGEVGKEVRLKPPWASKAVMRWLPSSTPVCSHSQGSRMSTTVTPDSTRRASSA